VWVTGATVYRVGRDCAVLQSVNPYGIASLSYGAVGGDGTLFMPESDALIAYTPALMERWRKPRTVWWTGWLGPPTVAGERLYAKVCADSLYALDAATGGVIWSQPSPDTGADVRVFATGPVPIGARVYLPGRVTFTAYDTAGTKLWQSPDNGTGISEPVVTADGRLFVQLQQSMVAWDESGNELWRSPYGATRFFGLAGGPALAEGGLVYIAGAKGFYALDLDGNVVWGTNAVAGDSAWVAGSPAIGPDGMIYTWGETHVYALFGTHRRDPTSPWPMWRHDAQRTGRVP